MFHFSKRYPILQYHTAKEYIIFSKYFHVSCEPQNNLSDLNCLILTLQTTTTKNRSLRDCDRNKVTYPVRNPEPEPVFCTPGVPLFPPGHSVQLRFCVSLTL